MKRAMLILAVLILSIHAAYGLSVDKKLYNIFPSTRGTTNDATTLNDTLEAIGSRETAIVIDAGQWMIDQDVTIPTNITVVIQRGSWFNVQTGSTLTINGELLAGAYRVFAGSGTVTGNAQYIYRYPQWGATNLYNVGQGADLTPELDTNELAQKIIEVYPNLATDRTVYVTALLNGGTVGSAGSVTRNGSEYTIMFPAGSISGGGTGAAYSVVSDLPPGTIMAFPTETPPSGWLHCNGSAYATNLYSDLFGVIGYTYGGTGTVFKVPDYRGYFLRGWNNASGRDPDAASRGVRGDGTPGDHVGTVQADQYGSHTHVLGDSVYYTPTGYRLDMGPYQGVRYGTRTTSAAGGSETRPDNVNVMWCIKHQAFDTNNLVYTADLMDVHGSIMIGALSNNVGYFGNGIGMTNLPRTAVEDIDLPFETWLGTNTYVQTEADPDFTTWLAGQATGISATTDVLIIEAGTGNMITQRQIFIHGKRTQ